MSCRELPLHPSLHFLAAVSSLIAFIHSTPSRRNFQAKSMKCWSSTYCWGSCLNIWKSVIAHGQKQYNLHCLMIYKKREQTIERHLCSASVSEALPLNPWTPGWRVMCTLRVFGVLLIVSRKYNKIKINKQTEETTRNVIEHPNRFHWGVFCTGDVNVFFCAFSALRMWHEWDLHLGLAGFAALELAA